MRINPALISSKVPILNPESTHYEKLPRFLFHFTNLDSAEKILKDGFIRTTADGLGLDQEGVFMVDFQNLVKNWTKLVVTDHSNQLNLLTCLLGQVAKGCEKIACFRIPSVDLTNRTVVRSQNELKKVIDSGSDFAPFFSKGSMYKLFQRNGHSIEYIHFGDIEVSQENFVGAAEVSKNLNKLFDSGLVDGLDLREIEEDSLATLKKIFESQPELKAFSV